MVPECVSIFAPSVWLTAPPTKRKAPLVSFADCSPTPSFAL